jgi:ribosomal small subunit protein bTHX
MIPVHTFAAMGKGDKKSKKGKLWIGSRGKKRPARKQNVKSLLRNKASAS